MPFSYPKLMESSSTRFISWPIPMIPMPDPRPICPRPGRQQWVIERERELRLYYDGRAGDYLEVGFRLCKDNEWKELHRCLADREFQILVLGYPGPDATFAGKPMEEFADSFVCPVILVGPEEPGQFYLNAGAALIHDKLGLPEGSWEKIELMPA